jgi:methyl-accepting chemotaxis protein
MLDSVRENSALIDGIAQASREQASAIAEVSTAVRQMDEMTQHNAALVEETNAAIEQTEAQASDLDRIVDVFVLSGQDRRPSVAAKVTVGHAKDGVKAVAARTRSAAKTYLAEGNAAVKQDWTEF